MTHCHSADRPSTAEKWLGIVAIAAIGVAIAVWLGWPKGIDDSGRGAAAAPPRSEEQELNPAPPAASAEDGRLVAAQPSLVPPVTPAEVAALEGSASLRVAVVNVPDGRGLSGIQVSIRASSPSGQSVVWSASTDPEGVASFTIPAPGTLHSISLPVGDTLAPTSIEDRTSFRPGERLSRGIEFPAMGAIEGIVRDGFGNPVAGAEVDAWFEVAMHAFKREFREPERSCLANGAGEYRLENLAGSVTLRASSPGMGSPCLFGGKLQAGGPPRKLDLPLVRLKQVQFAVLEPSGSPLAGATVRLAMERELATRWWPDAAVGFEANPLVWPEAVTDRGGRCSLSDVPLEAIDYVIRSEGRPSASGVIPADAVAVEVVLQDGIDLSGAVYSRTGAAIEGAVLDLAYAGEWRMATTAGDGRFTFRGLPPADRTGNNEAVLAVHAAGHARIVRELALGTQSTDLGRIELASERRIAGTVVGPDDSPVHGATVQLKGDRVAGGQEGGLLFGVPWEQVAAPSGDRVGQPSQGITDVEGRFAFGGLPSGRFRLEIFEGGKRTPAAIAQASAGDEALVIHLGDGVPRTLRLAGRVTDRDSGLPTRAFEVWVVQDGSRLPGKEFLDPAGAFQIDGLRPGDLWIKVEAKDPARCQIRRLLGLGPGERIEDFSLVEVGELTVTVTDQHGQPARAWVEIHDTADRELGQFRDPGLLASAGCDESGVAIFEALPAMSLYVAACIGRPEGHGTQLAVSLTPGGKTTAGMTVR